MSAHDGHSEKQHRACAIYGAYAPPHHTLACLPCSAFLVSVLWTHACRAYCLLHALYAHTHAHSRAATARAAHARRCTPACRLRARAPATAARAHACHHLPPAYTPHLCLPAMGCLRYALYLPHYSSLPLKRIISWRRQFAPCVTLSTLLYTSGLPLTSYLCHL